MRGALLASLAFLPGLCETAQDPSKGVPPEIWHLRQVMEKEVTRDGRGEYVTPEQAELFRDAAEDVAVYRNVLNVDAGAEIVYLLPRTWQWPQREELRDLIVLVGCGKGGAVLEAEQSGWGTEVRKKAFRALFSRENGLHTRTAPMAPAERVAAILADANAGAWGDATLVWEYAALALANDPAASVPELVKIVSSAGRLRPWALTVLARMDDPAATAALRDFYGPGDDDPRPAALRFQSTLGHWAEGQEVAVLTTGGSPALRPAAGSAAAVDEEGWAARAGDVLRIRLGVEQASLGRKALVVDGDRASVVVTEVVNRRPGVAEGPFAEASWHFRLRRRGGLWVVSRWSGAGT